MKIKILAVGRMKASPQAELCQEYLKRMNWQVSLKEIDTPKGATSAVEAPLILKHIPDHALVIALDERGETYSSPDFSHKLQQWKEQTGGEIIFLIGGADGFDNTVRQRAKSLMSFGKQTWPHMLVRVMLLEQIYRAQQIAAGHPYHRA